MNVYCVNAGKLLEHTGGRGARRARYVPVNMPATWQNGSTMSRDLLIYGLRSRHPAGRRTTYGRRRDRTGGKHSHRIGADEMVQHGRRQGADSCGRRCRHLVAPARDRIACRIRNPAARAGGAGHSRELDDVGACRHFAGLDDRHLNFRASACAGPHPHGDHLGQPGSGAADAALDGDDSGSDDLHAAACEAVHAARQCAGTPARRVTDRDRDGTGEFGSPRPGQSAAVQRDPHDQRCGAADSG